LLAVVVWAQNSDYLRLRAEAEKFYQEKSYARANELYQQAATLNLPLTEQRWVAFRIADTRWRAASATNTADQSHFDQAQRQLEALVRDINRVEDRDLVWAEVQESLGDFWWLRANQRSWGMAVAYYQQALDWWAGSTELLLARERYLQIIFRVDQPRRENREFYYGYWGNYWPIETLDNAQKIATQVNDQAHLHYLLAKTLRYYGGNAEQIARVALEFEAALSTGKQSNWHDDALFGYAEHCQSIGQVIFREDGGYSYTPNLVKALSLYRELLNRYQPGETRFYDSAKSRITDLTRPQLNLAVTNVFLPGSETEIYFTSRNIKTAGIKIYPVDLAQDIAWQSATKEQNNSDIWIARLAPKTSTPIKTLAVTELFTDENGQYKEQQRRLSTGQLPLGAYLVEAEAANIPNIRARTLLLITDAALVINAVGNRGIVYFCNALDGTPIADAAIQIAALQSNSQVFTASLRTNAQGIAEFKLPQHNGQVFALAALNNRQALVSSYANYVDRLTNPSWKLYAFTDRPAYRPGEEAQWKLLARTYDGSRYGTPAGQQLEYDIVDSRGTKVSTGQLKLNSFGSVSSKFLLTEQMPLGEYRIDFWTAGRQRNIGNATLLRLEEYKLPEFKVAVRTPEVAGRRATFQLGDKITVDIQADYYFGGAVAKADVQVVVYQKLFNHYWLPPREYPWYYAEGERYYADYGPGQVITQKTLQTNAQGQASFTLDTPRNNQQSLEYRIEARVVDASRREILASNTLKVTNQLYYVYPRPQHYIYRPQDKVRIDVNARDANNQPVAATGKVTVMRDYYYEAWINPQGQVVTGAALQALQRQAFPPMVQPGETPWRLQTRGYQHEEILTSMITTNAQGEASVEFVAPREGYYRLVWRSDNFLPNAKDQRRLPITAETTVWVLTNASQDVGYRNTNGIEIIVDQDTARVGRRLPVMLVAPTNGRQVLFSVEGEDIYQYQLVNMTGNVKLVEIDITATHVPNIFLQAASVAAGQIAYDTKEIIVPPAEQFLTVEVKPDRLEYQPREEGTLTINTRDHAGNPVAAEVALALVDEAVYYIQGEYRNDPRQFYYGNKRPLQVRHNSTMEERRYLRREPKPDVPINPGVAAIVTDEVDNESRRDADFGAQKMAGGFKESVNAPKSVAVLSSGKAGERKREANSLADSKDLARQEQAEGEGRGDSVQGDSVQVRNDFRATLFWQPDVVTNAQGVATVKIKYADSLTSWKAVARANTAQSEFGIAETTTQTQQPLIVRLQAPRFFLVGDLVTVSAVINNNTDKPLTVTPTLLAAGVTIKTGKPTTGKEATSKAAPISIPAKGETRVDWLVTPAQSGPARLRVSATADNYADAMERSYLVHEHGIEQLVSKSGKVRGSEITIDVDLPAARKRETTDLRVQVTPSLAVTMLDALPYLIDYPYGCTEQTMSRFLPAAITARTLASLQISPQVVMQRIFGGIEPKFADRSQPQGKRDLTALEPIIAQGLARLYDFQHSDGGWGWWKEGDSDHYMTGYVVWGLALARQANIAVRAEVLQRAIDYLDKQLVVEENNLDQQAWMLHALAIAQQPIVSQQSTKPQNNPLAKRSLITANQQRALDNIWQHRGAISAYTQALLALSSYYYQQTDKTQILVQNLENGVQRDNRPDQSVVMQGIKGSDNAGLLATAHWGQTRNYYRWSEGAVETTAFVLQALVKIAPNHPLIEPSMNWLVKNRRGAQWSNTRDTAMVILAMNDYLPSSKELQSAAEYELSVNGQLIAKRRFTAAEALTAPSLFTIAPELIKNGRNTVQLRQVTGQSALYFAVEARFFTLERPIAPSANEIFVTRQYYRLVNQETLLKGYKEDKRLLQDRELLQSGDRVEVVLTIEAKNDYEYLLFEDLKPAGLEAVQIRSGEALYAQELRADAVQRLFGTLPTPVTTNKAGNSQAIEANKSGKSNKVPKSAKPKSAKSNLPKSSTSIPSAPISPANGGIAPPGPEVVIDNPDAYIDAGLREIGIDPQTRQRIVPPEAPAPSATDFTGRTRYVYQELRDRKVALFIDKLAQGVWQIRYILRAETPGEFAALPVLGQALYVPEIRANSAEVQVVVQDK
jgi:uncharacterized protein YfaS (alpha-2-macroglobulin family)